jgi:hypothetical protein
LSFPPHPDTLLVSRKKLELIRTASFSEPVLRINDRIPNFKFPWLAGNGESPKHDGRGSLRKAASRASTVRNDYRCSIERNQGGKYCVRILAHYPRHAWTLGVFFLASSFDRAMKKLEESLDFLQRQEEKLWFWGVDRAEDMGFSAEFLLDAGLKLDRRTEFPRKAANLSLAPERAVPAFVLGPMRRGLAESVESTRGAAASD